MNSLRTLYNYKKKAMAEAFVKRYDIISGGTDNHMMDLRNKGFLEEAENALVKQKLL
jgi:glycine/serine hydroxymethyltransferase